MATKYVTYDDYLTEARKKAEEQQNAYAAARQQEADAAVKALNTAENASRQQIMAETEGRLDSTKAAYQSLYDENAVREKVAQLNVEETLANMGLSDSGLNRTQQTALAATRARADAAVGLKKQQAVDTLLTEMTAAIEKNRETMEAARNAARVSATEDIEQNRAALEKEAQTAATNQFNADLKAADQEFEQGMQSREFFQEVKEWTAENERQNQKIQADIALQKQKQSDATALQKQKQSDATALQKQKQSDSTALEKLKQTNSTALQKQKQSDATALQARKQADATALASQKQAASSNNGKTLTAAQKTDLAESLRKAISERSKIYNETLRKHYDDLIAYYEAQLY